MVEFGCVGAEKKSDGRFVVCGCGLWLWFLRKIRLAQLCGNKLHIQFTYRNPLNVRACSLHAVFSWFEKINEILSRGTEHKLTSLHIIFA